MTVVLSRPLAIPFVFSGSVHLGLMALLVVNLASEKPNEVVSIDWVEAPAVEVTQAVRTRTSAKEAVVVPVPVPAENSLTNELVQEAPVEQGTTGGLGSSSALSAEELYKSQLARELNSRKFYPSMARKLRHEGRVIVQFNVSRDGQVLEAKVVQPSPFQTLNQSAKQLVESLKVLSPFPEEIKKTTWLFRVPVDYQM